MPQLSKQVKSPAEWFFPTYLAYSFAVDISPPVPQAGPWGKWRWSGTACRGLIPCFTAMEATFTGQQRELSLRAARSLLGCPESDRETNAAAACSRYPNNRKPKTAFFFSLGGTGIPPSRWSSNTAKIGRGRRGVSVTELA